MADDHSAETLVATAAAYLRARSDEDGAALLERSRLEVLEGGEQWTVDGRVVRAVRVALWLGAADGVRVREHLERREALRVAVAAAVDTPATLLRELVVVQERVRAPELLPLGAAGGYRDRPPADPHAAPDGPTLAGTAAALLEAGGDAALAAAMRRASVAVERIGSTGGSAAARVFVALDPADLVAARRDPRNEKRLVWALELAGLGPSHRVVDVVFGLRSVGPMGGTADENDAETRLVSAARAAGWSTATLERDPRVTTLVAVREGRALIVRLDEDATAWRMDGAGPITIPASELADEEAAARAVSRL